MELKKVIMCPPRNEYFKGKAYHNFTSYPSLNAIQQHINLMETIQEHRCNVVMIEELKNHPNSVFVRDTAIVTPYGYIKAKMAHPSRKEEEEWMAHILESMGVEMIWEVRGKATVEGGDVILAGDTAFIGHSTRTNEDGVIQLKDVLQSRGYDVRIVKVPSPFIHLGGMMSIVGNAIFHCHHSFPPNFFNGFEEMKIKCGSFIGGNVIYIGRKEVIVEERNKEAKIQLVQHGFNIHSVNLSEFIKGNGGPSCLILPLEY